jgi:hypothetical protein
MRRGSPHTAPHDVGENDAAPAIEKGGFRTVIQPSLQLYAQGAVNERVKENDDKNGYEPTSHCHCSHSASAPSTPHRSDLSTQRELEAAPQRWTGFQSAE